MNQFASRSGGWSSRVVGLCGLFVVLLLVVLWFFVSPKPQKVQKPQKPQKVQKVQKVQGHTRGTALSWLNDHLIPIQKNNTLTPIVTQLAKHRVVALGESTHGTKEFFVLKGRLFRQLATHHGFTTLAMEMAYIPGLLIEKYLQTGTGDPSELVKGSYFFMEAKEIVSLIRWIRKYNQTHTRQLHFIGIDLQPKQRHMMNQKCGRRAGCRALFRDGFMSQNVLKQKGKVLLWAHNGHIAHFQGKDGWKPMGWYLQQSLGKNYYAMAMTFGEGGFIAPAGGQLPVRRTRIIKHLNKRKVHEYILPPPPKEALAHFFAQAKTSTYFIDLTQPNKAAAALFLNNRKLQTYGALPPPAKRAYEEYEPLHVSFDGLLFVKHTQGYTFPD